MVFLVFLFVSSSVQNDIFSGNVQDIMASLRQTVGNLGDFIGDKKGCKFECENGGQPKPNPHHVPSSNGCGAFGLKLEDHIELQGLTKCCDDHDFCYDACNNEKEACDRVFKKCLQRICKKLKGILSEDIYEGCKSTSDLLYAGTVALGCKPYKDAQQKIDL